MVTNQKLTLNVTLDSITVINFGVIFDRDIFLNALTKQK